MLNISRKIFNSYFKILFIFIVTFDSAYALDYRVFIPTIFTFSGGPAWASGGESQTLNLANEISKTYTANKPQHISANFEIFMGIQQPLPRFLLGQIGLSVAKVTSATLGGEIWDDANSEFNNYIYRYRLNHLQLALKGKLLANCRFQVIPWISGSIGIGFNRAHGFANTPKIYEALPNPNFASRNNIAFTYAIGFGIQHQMMQNWQIGIGYEFADWGRSELGRAQGQTTNDRITLSHFYTNSILLNLTYDKNDYSFA